MSSQAAESAYRSTGRLRECENKTIGFWDGLIEQFRFPYLKRRAEAFKQPTRMAELIRTRTDYPYELIESHWRNQLLISK